MKSDKIVSIRINSELYERFKNLSYEKGLTFSSFIKFLIIKELEKNKT